MASASWLDTDCYNFQVEMWVGNWLYKLGAHNRSSKIGIHIWDHKHIDNGESHETGLTLKESELRDKGTRLNLGPKFRERGNEEVNKGD